MISGPPGSPLPVAAPHEISGQKPGDGPILVTGATGGVGSIAVDILATAGYDHALGGKPDQFNG
jgi:NADPH:quinone reductase-like Zn-dependent oxidoreductase